MSLLSLTTFMEHRILLEQKGCKLSGKYLNIVSSFYSKTVSMGPRGRHNFQINMDI